MTSPTTKIKSKRDNRAPSEIVVTEIIARIPLVGMDADGDEPLVAVARALDPLVGGLMPAESRSWNADVLGVAVEITATAPPL